MELTPTIEAELEALAWCALSTKATLKMTYELTRLVLEEEIPGNLAECGVFAGAQITAMALANRYHGTERTLHLFDSFQGIPEPGFRDGADIRALLGEEGEGRLVTTGKSACSMGQVVKVLRQAGVDLKRTVFHPGWFQEVLPGLDISPIALLRLDGDLYESTRCCLEHLYHQVAPGGIVIVDDWPLVGCRMACEEFLVTLPKQPHVLLTPDGPAWWRVE